MCQDSYRSTEGSIGILSPLCLHNTVGVVFLKSLSIRAILAVYGDACRHRDEAKDSVALDRVAAACEFILQIVYLLVDDKSVARARCFRLSLRLHSLLKLFRLGCRSTSLILSLAREPMLEHILYVEEVQLLGSYRRVDLPAGAYLQLATYIRHSLIYRHSNLPILELSLQLLTSYTCELLLLGTQHRLDTIAGFRRNTEGEPVGFGLLVLLRHNLHNITIMQHLADRHSTIVHPATRTGRAQARMYVEGEVQHGSTLGQLTYVAIGCEDKNLTRRGLCLKTLRELMCGLLQRLTQT